MAIHDYRCTEHDEDGKRCEGAFLTLYVAPGDKPPRWKKCPVCGARMGQSYEKGNVNTRGRTYPFFHAGFGCMVYGPGDIKALCERYDCHEAGDKVGGMSPFDMDRQKAYEDENRPTFDAEMAQNFADEIAAGYAAGWTDEGDHNTEVDESTMPHRDMDRRILENMR